MPPGAEPLTLLDILAGWCGALPDGLPFSGSIVVGLFLMGAAGSPLHCGPMCGGFVLGQVADRMARLPAAGMCERHRLAAASLLPYHLGRLTTYAALGAIMGTSGNLLGHIPWLTACLLLVAAGSFAALALRQLPLSFARPGLAHRLGLTRWSMPPAMATWRMATWPWPRQLLWAVPGSPAIGTTSGLGSLRIGASRFLRRPGIPPTGYLLGLSLGFLPCGFLYGALFAAGATQSPIVAASAMVAFGLGTVPVLVLVGFAGQAAGVRARHVVSIFSPAVLLLNAAVLIALAARMLVSA